MSRRYEVGVGVLVLTALGLLAYMALQVGAIRGTGPTVEVDAIFPDAAGLSDGAVVAIAGVQVGRVSGLGIEFDRARAHLSIDASAQVRSDVRVRIRARSVLGEKYVELVPVSKEAPLLESGVTLVDESGQVEIDEMVSEMGPLLAAIDPRAIEVLTQAVAEDPERPKRMLADAEATLHALRLASEEFPALIADGRDTLAEVRATSARAEKSLAKAEVAIDRVNAVAERVEPEEVDALLAEARGAATDARTALQHADATLARADRAADQATEVLEGWSELDWETFRQVAQETGIFVRLTPVGKKKK